MINVNEDNPTLSLAARRRLDGLQPDMEALRRSKLPCPSETTAIQYDKASDRMKRRRLWPEEIGSRNRSTFNLHRAALVYNATKKLFLFWDVLIDPLIELTAQQAHANLDIIEACVWVLRRYPPADRESPSLWKRPVGGATRKGKRIGLSKLPADWRLTMILATDDNDRYNSALLISALTGVRPAELKSGVLVEAAGNGISVTISGAKVTETTGQPKRRLVFNGGSPLVQKLLLKLDGSESHELLISIEDPRKYSDYIRGLSRRLFPQTKYTASPYSLRHKFSADQKAAGMHPVSLAEMLGHISERSPKAYGTTRQGSRALAHVVSVIASRPVRPMRDITRPWRSENSIRIQQRPSL